MMDYVDGKGKVLIVVILATEAIALDPAHSHSTLIAPSFLVHISAAYMLHVRHPELRGSFTVVESKMILIRRVRNSKCLIFPYLFTCPL